MSMAEANLLRSLLARVEALEALVAADPVIERIQRLEMRIGSLQGQINLLRNKAAPAPPEQADAAA